MKFILGIVLGVLGIFYGLLLVTWEMSKDDSSVLGVFGLLVAISSVALIIYTVTAIQQVKV